MLPVVGRPEIAAVISVITLLVEGGSESAGSGDLSGAVIADVVVEVESAWVRLVVVLVVSGGFVSLKEAEGEVTG